MSKASRNQGLTLIELLMVIFIIGIMAAIALPLYGAYSTRAKLSEGVTLARAASNDARVVWNVQGRFPNTDELADLNGNDLASGAFVESIAMTADGTMTVTFKPDSGVFGSLVFVPEGGDGTALKWTCTSPDIDNWLLPKSCR